jgi:hypothetical protein
MINRLLLLFTILVFACSTTENGNSTLNLLPRDNDIQGWIRDKASTEQAFDQQSLYDVIDGGAEEYLRYGFIEGAFATYANGQKSYGVWLEIYKQDTSENAELLFDYLQTGSYTPIDENTRIAEGFGNLVIEGLRENYLIRISANLVPQDDLEEARIIINAFLEIITGLIND